MGGAAPVSVLWPSSAARLPVADDAVSHRCAADAAAGSSGGPDPVPAPAPSAARAPSRLLQVSP